MVTARPARAREQEAREERQRLRRERGEAYDPAEEGGGSFDEGDPFTTNLYVGNLAPDVDEEARPGIGVPRVKVTPALAREQAATSAHRDAATPHRTAASSAACFRPHFARRGWGLLACMRHLLGAAQELRPPLPPLGLPAGQLGREVGASAGLERF